MPALRSIPLKRAVNRHEVELDHFLAAPGPEEVAHEGRKDADEVHQTDEQNRGHGVTHQAEELSEGVAPCRRRFHALGTLHITCQPKQLSSFEEWPVSHRAGGPPCHRELTRA